VSTARQGQSGLGLEAQRVAVRAYLNGSPVSEFTEIESGKVNDRPKLTAAILECRLTGARLVIAKLDRLSRNAAFLLTLRDSGVQFVATDMPDANALTVGIMALMAQHEREAISTRTKAALAVLKARGVKLGNPNGARALRGHTDRTNQTAAVKRAADYNAELIIPVIRELQRSGYTTLRAVADELNVRGIRTPRHGQWHASSVARTIERTSCT
jgi:DNA invertase Pin-like site-specific DNA recombinase